MDAFVRSGDLISKPVFEIELLIAGSWNLGSSLLRLYIMKKVSL
jgi:hypothetical protein